MFVLGGSRGTPQTDHWAVALFQKGPSVCLYRASAHQLCSLGEPERTTQGWCDAAGLQQTPAPPHKPHLFPLFPSRMLALPPHSILMIPVEKGLLRRWVYFCFVVLNLARCCSHKRDGKMMICVSAGAAGSPLSSNGIKFTLLTWTRAKIKTNTQMNHSFVHFAWTFLFTVSDTHGHKLIVFQTQSKNIWWVLKSLANKLGLLIPSDSFLTSNADQTCCLLTWLRESLFISPINPQRKGHKAPCTTVVMSSLWKCYPTALNPSATCCEKASTLLSGSPLK